MIGIGPITRTMESLRFGKNLQINREERKNKFEKDRTKSVIVSVSSAK